MPLKVRLEAEFYIPDDWINKSDWDWLKDDRKRIIEMLADDPIELLRCAGDPLDIIKILGWEKKCK